MVDFSRRCLRRATFSSDRLSIVPLSLLSLTMIIVFEDLRIVVEFGSVLFHPPVVGLFVYRFAPLELDQESGWMPESPRLQSNRRTFVKPVLRGLSAQEHRLPLNQLQR
jgi:hypothetical protein